MGWFENILRDPSFGTPPETPRKRKHGQRVSRWPDSPQPIPNPSLPSNLWDAPRTPSPRTIFQHMALHGAPNTPPPINKRAKTTQDSAAGMGGCKAEKEQEEGKETGETASSGAGASSSSGAGASSSNGAGSSSGARASSSSHRSE